jgi:hypothetical protein
MYAHTSTVNVFGTERYRLSVRVSPPRRVTGVRSTERALDLVPRGGESNLLRAA